MTVKFDDSGVVIASLFGAAGIPTFPAGAAAADGVSIAEVLRYAQENVITGTGTALPTNSSLWGALAGATGVTTWPTKAEYASGVSIAEALAFVSEGVIRGTGTALAANESLADVLYAANGIATFPAAAVPANGVSIAEVLRDVWDALRNGTGGTEPGANKSLADAIGFNGVTTIASTAGMLRTAAGTYFVVTKSLTSSDILTTGVSVTGNATGGDIYVEKAIFQTNATGLAAGTNFQLQAASNTEGRNVIWSETVANLGTSVTEDFSSGSVQSATQGFVLKSGLSIAAACTAAD